MEKKIQTRAILIGAVVLACLFGIVGFPRNVQELKANVRDRIRLGLDLRGGMHLILQVHVDDAVNVKSDQDLERLRDELKAKSIPYAECNKIDISHIATHGLSCIIDEKINASILLKNAVHQRLNRILVAHIGGNCDSLAMLLMKLIDNGMKGIGRACRKCDLCSGLRKETCGS